MPAALSLLRFWVLLQVRFSLPEILGSVTSIRNLSVFSGAVCLLRFHLCSDIISFTSTQCRYFDGCVIRTVAGCCSRYVSVYLRYLGSMTGGRACDVNRIHRLQVASSTRHLCVAHVGIPLILSTISTIAFQLTSELH
jgi:hypothetical protein